MEALVCVLLQTEGGGLALKVENRYLDLGLKRHRAGGGRHALHSCRKALSVSDETNVGDLS